jgi:hypothetical protein
MMPREYDEDAEDAILVSWMMMMMMMMCPVVCVAVVPTHQPYLIPYSSTALADDADGI